MTGVQTCALPISIVQYNSETVKRFKNTYKDEMDVAKFNKFVETHF